ncbi:hypothetical protein [uncultured Marinobacter sp.]|uniref:hypothetical protein n=1 Tax=uncultured Marinobacter sp. TaxID=187379 RepID=UPI00262DBF6C|nr:hypothetical protein [uncultured Marinobacter sp.]
MLHGVSRRAGDFMFVVPDRSALLTSDLFLRLGQLIKSCGFLPAKSADRTKAIALPICLTCARKAQPQGRRALLARTPGGALIFRTALVRQNGAADGFTHSNGAIGQYRE